ncbi:unnamed protein product (macronuclear) [Paramecium tetraurelia]|uniref:Uncharacterized protein n=1 Tax=Paramecium tetraurelia TaxID=5888 RepID=A0CGY2_PARTE|nr:uncharacterized protein GSPATT00007489001 [Paramecium tetraurelia]CAK70049.1 unnamed protein product [Paramecium tetraurelia]|eukprot:XP_001437446.1 hypothetical protein (macronuclear) [Paramecium tetraurelia strain d4-2]
MKTQKTELVLLLLICTINCVSISKQDGVEELKKTSWGKIAWNLSQLAFSGDSALKELADVLTSVTEQVKDLRHDHEFASDKAINVYDSKREQLDLEIDETVTFIARNTDYLDTQMHDYIVNINKRLENLDKNVQENRKQLEYLTFTRQKQNEKFLDTLSQYEHMVAQVDMCIALLQGIFANEEFIQVDRVKIITRKIFAATMLIGGIDMKELLETTESAKYTDTRVQKYILEAFNNLRKQFIDHKNSDIAYDAEQQKEYEDQKHQLDGELLIFKKDIAELIYNLSVTEEKIRQIKDDIESNRKDQEFYSKEKEFINNGRQIEEKWKSKIIQGIQQSIIIHRESHEFNKPT